MITFYGLRDSGLTYIGLESRGNLLFCRADKTIRAAETLSYCVVVSGRLSTVTINKFDTTIYVSWYHHRDFRKSSIELKRFVRGMRISPERDKCDY